MMCVNLPNIPFKCFQQAFPIFVAAFLSEIGVSKNFDSMDFVPCLVPYDKIFDYHALGHEKSLFCKVSDYFNKGTITSACHEKGNRESLGQLTLTLDYYNCNLKHYQNSHDGIISLALNCDGVK